MLNRMYLLAIIACLVGGVLHAQPSNPTLEQITRFTKAYPAISPSGDRLAYMSNADGDFDIYVSWLGERRVKQLTDAPGRDGTPVWSPDGTRIAFQSFREGPSQIYVMDATGAHQRNLSQNNAHEEHPFWSADGRQLLFCSNRDAMAAGDSTNMDIYRMTVDGTMVTRITTTPTVETYASWSPDQSQIVCRQIQPNGDWEVVVMDTDGTHMRNLSDHAGVDGWPAWSPDGRHIAYAAESAGAVRLFVMRADGSGRVRLLDDASEGDRQPWWHPRGTHLFFTRYRWFQGSPWYESAEIFSLRVPETALK
ncbi:MAG: hypothetical protein R6U13_07785 [Desulfatiglandaceae bacterium]